MSKKTSIIWTIERNDLQNIIDGSSSLCDVLRKLGYKKFSDNCLTLKQRIDYDNLKMDNMELNRMNNRSSKKLENEDIFKINSGSSTKIVRERIFKENLLEYKCKLCGLGNQWNGKDLVLQLDHINGDTADNRIENLRWVCPNCHSETETYCGKKNKKEKKKYFCTECHKEICKTSIRCNACRSIKSMKANISEEELRKLIQEDKLSYVAIGKIFGITNAAVKKRCIKFGIIKSNKVIPTKPKRELHIKVASSEMFKENSAYNNHKLKKRIAIENLLEYKCKECGLGCEWNGKYIVAVRPY